MPLTLCGQWCPLYVKALDIAKSAGLCALQRVCSFSRSARQFGIALAVFGLVVTSGARAAEFEVGAGYLSANVRDMVESYGWSLVWAADEDRVVDYPFTVSNGSLQEALAGLLTVYGGQFVADVFEGNRVVVIDAAPPRVRIQLPGEDVDAVGVVELSTERTYGEGGAPVEPAVQNVGVGHDATRSTAVLPAESGDGGIEVAGALDVDRDR